MLIALDNSLVNKFLIIDFLEENLNKDNYYFIMQILRIFFDDVFTQQISSEAIFKKFHKTIEKYQQIQERFYEIHFFIEEFILKLKTNTNFKIQKQFFLTKIIGLYEN